MCGLTTILAFVAAHIVAWNALGKGWRGAARAPFAVFPPVVALLLLNAVFRDSFAELPYQLWAFASWEALYFLVYACLRVMLRPLQPVQKV